LSFYDFEIITQNINSVNNFLMFILNLKNILYKSLKIT